jgi:hypothetical protein
MVGCTATSAGGMPSMKFHKSSGEVISVRNRKSAIKKAKEHFQSILTEYFGEPAFILEEASTSIVPGAVVTDVLFLSRFIDMFGDLVEKEDYRISSYQERNRDGDFRIAESVFDEWLRAECLRNY